MRLAPIALTGLLVLAGCTHYPGGIAPSTVPLAPGGYQILQKDVVSESCLVALLGLIPISTGNSTHGAIESAIASVKGANALVNVSSDMYQQYWILWSNTCTEVHGDAVSAH